MGLWILLAIVVFNVRFDWETRTAGFVFAQAQLARQSRGLPVISINDGFRPMVRAATIDSSKWLVLIASLGVVFSYGASRRSKAHA